MKTIKPVVLELAEIISALSSQTDIPMACRIGAISRNCRRQSMSLLGSLTEVDEIPTTSALTSRTDQQRTSRHVSLMPKGTFATTGKSHRVSRQCGPNRATVCRVDDLPVALRRKSLGGASLRASRDR